MESERRLRPLLACLRAVWLVAIEEDGVKARRGFAAMSRERQQELCRKGGKAVHERGTAHTWTSEEARAAGRKGGLARSANRKATA